MIDFVKIAEIVLRAANAYEACMTNIAKVNTGPFDDLVKSNHKDWLYGAFAWSNTDEGHAYWANIAHQWSALYELLNEDDK